ncbi:MAG: mimivirus elongation factor aef-2 [Edafosvirus sp.]|uniref:Elongation factor 2 n=1 Tax=Edafosvirus sp. TaxID=2487765 RepID=A0A3G4ZW54_9VIRU|nr:MAG: mimivirus elongation factor aef-2 [Edafosvirus sp.]
MASLDTGNVSVETKEAPVKGGVHHTDKVRNLSIVAHVDHGKSSLSDSILQLSGMVSKENAGRARVTDNRQDEIDRGITIKSTGVTLTVNGYTINLIDSPGHADFNAEVSAALRVTDGALVLVDAVENVCIQTKTVLNQALAEKVTPILIINKIDRYFSELALDAESAYNQMNNIIATINSIIQTYRKDDEFILSPEKGNVFFTCGLHNWGFGLKQFAKLYSKKINMPEEKLMTYLWGDYYFNPKTKTITKDHSVSGAVRVFNKLIYEPIQNLYTSIRDAGTPMPGVPLTELQEASVKKYTELMTKLDITLTKAEMKLSEKQLFKATMQNFVPLGTALLDGIINHLPSPVQAQAYRASVLYDGPQDDETFKSIKNCDPDGPLMIYISKNVPTADNSRFYAFGRVFSGTVKNGQKVTILGANYVHGKKLDMYVDKNIQGVSVMIGNKINSRESVMCGNTVALSGIDGYFTKTATITSIKDEPYPIKTMKLSVSPVVQVAIKVKNSSDLPKLSLGIKKLIKSDPSVVSYTSENGQIIIGATGELHMEICLNDLREFMNDAEIIVSKPIVPFRETISIESKECMAKSPNRHNRITVVATPLSEALVKDLEAGNFNFRDMASVSRRLVNEHGWEPYDAKKIWSFGPFGEEANILVDGTKAVAYLHEIKDSVINGFQNVCKGGPLCGEPVRGVMFKIVDVVLIADAIHRSTGQIEPASRRVMTACILTGKPQLIQPYYKLNISVTDEMVGTVYSAVGYKGGKITDDDRIEGTQTKMLTGTLPVLSSFGFDAFLREKTSGAAYPSCIFDHWGPLAGDPLDKESKVHQIIIENRKQKDIEAEIPPLDRFLDKL